MSTRLVNLVLDARDIGRLGHWWADALGWRVTEEYPDEIAIEPPEGTPGLPLVFVPVDDPKAGKNRLHLDLASSSLAEQTATVDLLVSAGATRIDIGQGAVPWIVLADPEGNEFCVLEPKDAYADTGKLAAVVVDAADPARLAEFWSAVAGWPAADRDCADKALRASTGPFLEFNQSSDPKSAKARLHLDTAPEPDDDRVAEIARVRALGATPVDIGQGPVTWDVLADPEGNEFCILSNR